MYSLEDEKRADAAAEPHPTGCPLGKELTEKLRLISRQYCEAEGGCHGPDHTERVHNLALHLGKLMQARLDILSGAALLHDIGRQEETRAKGRICHAEKGAELARKILKENGLPEEKIREIAHCIEAHRYRNNRKPVSVEARILYDADKLDSIGAVGIGRAFLFAGQVGAKLHNHNSNIDNTASYSLEDTAYREFRVKLCKIRDRMLTPEGRRLAEERHDFMEIFFRRLEREINGSRDSGPLADEPVSE
jgi:uncharacterized protein